MQLIREVPLKYKAQSSNMQVADDGLSVPPTVDESGLTAPSSSEVRGTTILPLSTTLEFRRKKKTARKVL